MSLALLPYRWVLVHPTSLVFVAIVGLWGCLTCCRSGSADGTPSVPPGRTDRHSLVLRVLQPQVSLSGARSPSTAPLIPSRLRTPPVPVPVPVARAGDLPPAVAPGSGRRLGVVARFSVVVARS